MISSRFFCFFFLKFWFHGLLRGQRLGLGVKGQKIAQNEKWNYDCHAPYSRNSIAYDHDFWYSCVKSCLQIFVVVVVCLFVCLFFYIFLKFSFFWLSGGKGVKNSSKSTITITFIMHHISQEQCNIWSWFLLHLCNMMILSGFFSFYWNFNFLELLGE